MKTTKQRFQPWSQEEKKHMEHSILQIECSKLSKDSEIFLVKEMNQTTDLELDDKIGELRNAEKSARLMRIKAEFDKANNITKKESLLQLKDAEKESARLAQNLKAMTAQLNQGKPILDAVIEKKTNVPEVVEPGKKEEEQEVEE